MEELKRGSMHRSAQYERGTAGEPGRYDENGDVCLGSAGDHVGDEALVAGSVENREMLLFGLEKRATALHLREEKTHRRMNFDQIEMLYT